MIQKQKYIIINLIIIILIMIGLGYILLEKEQETKTEVSYIPQNTNIEKQSTLFVEEYPEADIIEEYKGYIVCAKLEIPSIDLETYVLQNYSISALNISVTKFWGVNPNEVGNFCIAGHNFKNKNMFKNLKKVNIGETIIVSDNNIGIIEYQIYDKYTVEPEDTSCLNQETDGEREVTLITCTADSKKRIIIKAKESE